jgi:hypothetical protein
MVAEVTVAFVLGAVSWEEGVIHYNAAPYNI